MLGFIGLPTISSTLRFQISARTNYHNRKTKPCRAHIQRASSLEEYENSAAIITEPAIAALAEQLYISPAALPQIDLLERVRTRITEFVHYGNEHDAKIFQLALPSYGTMILDPMATLVDSAMCGRLGVEALGGIGASGPMTSYISWMFFLSVTTTSGVSQMMAKKDDEGARKRIVVATWVALSLGIVAGAVMYLAAPMVMQAMAKSPAVLPHAIAYLQSRALGAPAVLCFFVASGAMRGFQDLKTPLFASIAANLMNLCLNYVLMFVLGMGVYGAGLATAASQYTSSAVLFYFMFKQGRLRWSDFAAFPKKEDLKQTLKGATLILRKVLENLSFALTVSYIASLGTTALAAHQIARSVWTAGGVAWSPLCVTMLALCSKLVAEKNFAEGHKIAQRIMRLGVLAAICVSATIIVCSPWIPRLFGADMTLLPEASLALICAASTFPLCAMVDLTENISMAYSDYKFSTQVMTAAFVVRAIALTIVCKLRLGIPFVWMVYALFFSTRFILNLLRIRHRKRLETGLVAVVLA